MRPLHPLLAGVNQEHITFDRSDRPKLYEVKIRDANGNELREDVIDKLLEGTDRSLRRKWITDNMRAKGFFSI